MILESQATMRSGSGVAVLLLGALAVAMAMAAEFDYGEALDKTFLFFEAQRSGELPPHQRVKWRGDSGLKDGLLQGANLVGGYYDAGDHVKFGLPMAFTVTMLAWGAIEYKNVIVNNNQMQNTLWAIRWGTDYFIKAHAEPNVLWAQVGDGESDHYCWERAEDMTTSRQAYKLDQYHPGSDLVGETAAALAAASIAFKPYNSSYSRLMLEHAKELFTFADSHRGQYDDSITNSKEYYESSGYSDELLWAAAWLFRATGVETYLKYVVDNGEYMGGTGWSMKEFSWDNKYAGVQILLTKILLDGKAGSYSATLKQYQAKAEYFVCACLKKNGGYNIQTTPGGLMYVREWNNMQYVSAAAFLLAVYSDYLSVAKASLKCPDGSVQPEELLSFSKSQADYILGDNPSSTSYLVGHGPKYPQYIHHRGASIPSINVLHSTVGCVQGFDVWYRRAEKDPNVLHGALVGGPDEKDKYYDERSKYEQTEPTTSGTAPLVGLFAKLHGTYGKTGSYGKTPPAPEQSKQAPKAKPPSPDQKPPPAPSTYTAKSPGEPVECLHSITYTWAEGRTKFYRHKVVIKNASQKPVADLKLKIEDLDGSLWGLDQTGRNTYELPSWQRVLQPGESHTFVYVQGGPQAKVSVLSYS